MKRLKDFIYNTNDILLALLIIGIAILVIMWRMNAIMDYPATLIAENNTQSEQAEGGDSTEPLVPDSVWVDGVLGKDVTVTISDGTAAEAVQSLVDAGLFESYDDFAKICDSAGLSPEKIHAKEFTFTAGSTQTDIASTVTN